MQIDTKFYTVIFFAIAYLQSNEDNDDIFYRIDLWFKQG